jgi:hypothetical protein
MRPALELPARPFLAWTRKFGWIVVEPVAADPRRYGPVGQSRPNANPVYHHEILAIADLPPPPDAAL